MAAEAPAAKALSSTTPVSSRKTTSAISDLEVATGADDGSAAAANLLALLSPASQALLSSPPRKKRWDGPGQGGATPAVTIVKSSTPADELAGADLVESLVQEVDVDGLDARAKDSPRATSLPQASLPAAPSSPPPPASSVPPSAAASAVASPSAAPLSPASAGAIVAAFDAAAPPSPSLREMVLEEEVRTARQELETTREQARRDRKAMEHSLNQARRTLAHEQQLRQSAEAAAHAAAAAAAAAQSEAPAAPAPWEGAMSALLEVCERQARELELMLEVHASTAEAAHAAGIGGARLEAEAALAELEGERQRRMAAEATLADEERMRKQRRPSLNLRGGGVPKRRWG